MKNDMQQNKIPNKLFSVIFDENDTTKFSTVSHTIKQRSEQIKYTIMMDLFAHSSVYFPHFMIKS